MTNYKYLQCNYLALSNLACCLDAGPRTQVTDFFLESHLKCLFQSMKPKYLTEAIHLNIARFPFTFPRGPKNLCPNERKSTPLIFVVK